jgi:CheY-like chemotaxis protein
VLTEADGAKDGQSRQHTILVVDDEDAVRDIVADTLLDAGFHVLEAASGEEALVTLGRAARVDLLFTDIRMPGLDGFELADAALQLRPALRVLFTTGYTVRPPRPEMVVLRKPYRVSQLLAAVRTSLEADALPAWHARTSCSRVG